MVRHSAKKKKKDHFINYSDDSPVTRLMLKKLARAKAVPEIYKEVVRSKRRKTCFFQVPDVNFNSFHKNEQNEELNKDDTDDNEQILIKDTNRKSEDDVHNRCAEEDINVVVVSPSCQTDGEAVRRSNVSECAPQDREEDQVLKGCTAEKATLTKDCNSLTGLVHSSTVMPQKGSRTRKSTISDSRSVSSPGVITRSQLKQLANSKTVPEEYKNFLENKSAEVSVKEGKSPEKKNQPAVNISTTPRRRRVSCKKSDDETLVEQTCPATLQGNDHIHDDPGSSAENNSSFINEAKRTKSKKKKQSAEKVDTDDLINGRMLKKREEKECDSYTNSCKQSVSEKDRSIIREEIRGFEGSEEKTSDALHKVLKPVDYEITDNTSADHNNKRNSLKRLVNEKAASKRKGGKTRKIDNVKGQEMSEILHLKSQRLDAREHRASICEPVDMSISEDCSGTEKILYCAKSQSSDSETPGTSLKNSKKPPQDSSKEKSSLLKKDKKLTAKETTKSPEVSSATSSSYNSGYEITPSRSQTVSKECSFSTKTTDSGIAVMVDSNPYGDSDSSLDDKQETQDTGKKFNTHGHTEFKTKEGYSGNARKSIVTTNMSNSTKLNNLPLNESTPSDIVKQTQVRQPFLVRMPVSVEEDIDSDSDAESRKAIMLSAQRRIEQNLSTTDSEGRRISHHQTPSSSLHDGEDSDDAPPDSMSFEAGRNLASESLRDAVESISRDRQRRKQRRRIRLEKLRQQKEEKLIRLKERLASQEDASCSSSEESGYEDEELRHFKKKPPSRERSKAERERIKSKKRSSNAEARILKPKDLEDETQLNSALPGSGDVSKRLPDELLERLSAKAPTEVKQQSGRTEERNINKNATTTHMKRKKGVQHHHSEQSDEPSDSQSFKKPPSLDYIPLKSTSSTKFAIMPFDKVGNVSKSAAQKAAEFRQNMMFGNHHKREPANTNLIYQQKLKASGKDVFARKKY